MVCRAHAVLLGLTLASAGCGAAYDADEVNRVLFKDSGVVGGYDFGVTWEEIKANHDDVFEVRDDGVEQLRRKSLFHNAGENGYFVGFAFDDDGGVERFSVTLSGANADTIAEAYSVHEQLRSKYESEYGPGTCSAQPGEGTSGISCRWSHPLSIELGMSKLEDSTTGWVDVRISKSSM